MTVYALAQLSIKDRAAYDRYQARFMEVFRRFKGRLLAADETPSILEGVWNRDKVVLISFPDEASFRDWYQSAAYQEIAKDRRGGADAVALLISGRDSNRAPPSPGSAS
jgi:uncharacterized protein (DUF1330 family)